MGEWRLIEPEGRNEQPPEAHTGRSTRLWLGVVVALVLASVGLAIWATLPAGGVAIDASAAAGVPRGALEGGFVGDTVAATPGALAPSPEAPIVVDVDGAVVEPGLQMLPSGSRVGDAIAAAGGYSAAVDIAAAASLLNLAAKLGDGDQLYVPRLGDAAAPAASSPSISPGEVSGGLIDLNNASAEQLETLPGIGPVTAAKIIDARGQAPFATVDELLGRGVVGPSTFEKIRDLVTVAP